MDVAISLWPFFMRYGYAILLPGIALENVGLPLPGEVFLFAAGLLASTGSFNLFAVIALGTAGAVVGDSLGYFLGRLGGERLPQLYCRMTMGSTECVRKTHEYFTRRGGGLTVTFARFVVGIRAFAAPMAGATGMAYPHFLVYDALGRSSGRPLPQQPGISSEAAGNGFWLATAGLTASFCLVSYSLLWGMYL